MENLRDLRRSYDRATLEEADLRDDPIEQFRRWFAEAEAADIDEPHAMTLATVDHDGLPDARVVLLKGLDDDGFCFFTNYLSAKGEQLGHRPYAALVFRWGPLERQVRVRGPVERLTANASDDYFASRPRASQLGAIVSPQSAVIADRAVLEDAVAALVRRHGDTALVRPDHWGGYRVAPQVIEFWQGRPNRLHDRIRYTRGDPGARHESARNANWERVRLGP